MAGGHIGIAVFPNMRKFHEDIKSAVRKWDDTKIEIDLKVDDSELTDLKRSLKRFPKSLDVKTKVDESAVDDFMGRNLSKDLQVDLDTDEAEASYLALRAVLEEPINIPARLQVDERSIRNAQNTIEDIKPLIESNLVITDRDARETMERFKDDYESFTMNLVIERVHADREMDDFFLKYRKGLTVDIGANTADLAGLTGMSRQITDLAGMYNPFEFKQWQATTFIGDMVKTMNEAFAAGINEIYTPYVKMGKDLVEFVPKHFARQWDKWMSASTINEAFKSFVPSEETKKKIGEGLLDAFKHLRTIDTSVRNLGKGVKNSFSAMRRSVADFGSRVKGVGKTLKDSAVGDTVEGMAMAFAGLGRTVGRTMSFMTRQGRRVWDKVMDVSGLKQAADHVAFTMKWLRYAIPEGISDAFRNTEVFFRGGWLNVSQQMRVLGINMTQAARNVGAQAGQALGRAFGAVLSRLPVNNGDIANSLRGISSGLGNQMTRLESVFGGAMAKLRGSLPNMQMIFGKGFSLRSAFDGMIPDALDGVKNFGLRVRKGMGDQLLWIGEDVRNRARIIGLGFSNGLTKSFGAISKSVSRIGGLFNRIGDNEFVKKATNRIFRTMGNYVSGFLKFATGAFAKMSGVIFMSVVPALKAAAAGIALMAGHAAVAAVLALAGAIMSVAHGAIVMAPAVVAAFGTAAGVIAIGMEGVKDAVTSALSVDSVEEFEEAMKELPASVQEVARAFRTFKPAVDEMKRAVQDNLLEGLRPGIQDAMGNLLPSISTGLQGTATAMNAIIKEGLAELGSDRAGAGMENIMQNTVRMFESMRPALGNLIATFGTLADQGAKYLPNIGSWISDITDGMFKWADGLREVVDGTDGLTKFDVIVQKAADNARLLGQIFGGLFGALGNLLNAATEADGTSMLQGMADGAQRLKENTEKGTAGFQSMTEFIEGGRMAAERLAGAISPFWGVVTDIGGLLYGIGYNSIPGIITSLNALDTALDPIREIGDDIGVDLSNTLTLLAPTIENLGAIMAPVLEGIVQGLANFASGAAGPLERVTASFAKVGEALGPVFGQVGTSLGEIFTALEPVLVSGANILEGLMPVLSVFFDWIGKISSKIIEVVAPLLTEHDEAIRKVLDEVPPLLDVIGGAIMTMLDMLQPLFGIIADIFGKVIEVVAWLLPIITPVIGFILQFLARMIGFFAPFVAAITGIAAGFAGLIGVVLVAVKTFGFLKSIITGVRTVWMLLSMAFTASPIGMVITLVALLVAGLVYFFTQTDTGKAIWERFTTALQDGWQSFSERMQQGWQNIVDYVWNPMVAWATDIGNKWNNFTTDMRNRWSDFANGIREKWDNTKENVSEAARQLRDSFVNTIQNLRDRVKGIWDGIKEVFASPIRFFIETVINDGLVENWNKAMGMIKKEKEWGLNRVPVPASLKFATGGVMPGYTPGKDVHKFYSPTAGLLHLSGGEAIMRPEWTRAVGGPQAVEDMNRKARTGQLKVTGDGHGNHYNTGGVYAVPVPVPVQSFAGGGTLRKNPGVVISTAIQRSMERAVAAAFPNQIITSGTRYEDVGSGFDNHMAGRALDFAADGQLAAWIARTYPNSAELFWDPGPNIKNGRPTGAIGGHSDHVHWAMQSMVDPYTGEVVSQGAPAGGGGGVNPLWAMAKGVIDKMKGAVERVMEGLMSPFGTYGRIGTGFASDFMGKGVEALTDKVKELLPDWMTGGGGAGGGGLDSPEAIRSTYRQGIMAAFRRQGETPTEERLAALERQIWSESKGDPNIAQQIVDVNGTGESAGVGLYQVIPGTFAAYRDPSLPNDRRDIEAQHNFAVRYFRDRHNWNTGPGGVGRGHGWKSGGIFDPALTGRGVFDEGGEARGVGFMGKNVLVPERILSPIQTKAFNEFVFRFLPELIRSYKNNPMRIRNAVNDLIDGWNGIQGRANAQRAEQIEAMSGHIADTFTKQIDGVKKTETEVDLRGLRDRFAGRNVTTVTADSVLSDARFLESWTNAIKGNLTKNLTDAINDSRMISSDPHAYLEAEQMAKKRLDEEEKLAKEKRDEQIAEAERKKSEEEREKRREAREKEKEGLDEKALELKEVQWKREDEERQKAEQAEQDRIREAQRAEDERIAALKESGEYYYGYKVLKDDGTNPDAYEDSERVKEYKRYGEAGAEFVGLTEAYNGVMTRLTVLQSLDSNIKTAMPSWIAALNGDRSGLNHNIAAAQAANYDETSAGLQELGPSALFGLIEMVSSGTASTAPFIGTVNSGMTPSQLNSTLTHYEATRARQRTGTMRTR